RKREHDRIAFAGQVGHRCVESDRRVKYPRPVHMDRQTDLMRILTDISTGGGRHNTAAGEIMCVLEADQPCFGLVIGDVDLESRLDLVPREVTRAVRTL